jgi:septal ring factor EnvC (AmiA/AmiB activator)
MNNQMISMTKKFILYTTFIVLVTIPSLNSVISGYAQSAYLQSKYDQQKSEIDSKIGTLNNQINSLSADLEQVTSRKNTLLEQVQQMRNEIANTESLITETKLAVNTMDGLIEENEKKITTLKGDMKNLIREIQKQDKASPLEAILSSKNIGEVLSNAYNLSSIQDKANKISKSIQTATAELNENKKTQENTQKTLESTQLILRSKKDGLDALLVETQGQEDKYQLLLQASKDQKKDAQVAILQLDQGFKDDIAKEAAELERQRQANANYGGGSSGSTADGAYGYETNGASCRFSEQGRLTAPEGYFIWPAPPNVSQSYGCPSSAGNNHDAFDIANSSGTPIVATASGTVVTKGYHPPFGFGNFVVIRHILPSGQRVYSLYAHMLSASLFSKGDLVKQGQTIGYMGQSGVPGNGVHLHFQMLSDSFESTGNVGCNYGNSKCFDPATFLP